MSHLGGLVCVHTSVDAVTQAHAFVGLQMPGRGTWRAHTEALSTDVPSPYIQNHPGVVRILRRGEPGAGLRSIACFSPHALLPCLCLDPARPDSVGGAHAGVGAAARAGCLLLRPGVPHKAGRRASGACLLYGLGPF